MPDTLIHRKDLQITIYANSIVHKHLEPMLQRAELADFCTFEDHKEEVVILRHKEQEVMFPLPVRVGVLFDQIVLFCKKSQRQGSAYLDLGCGILNIDLGRFSPPDGKAEILLTEKEVEILQYLHDNAERKIPRDELLEFVWGYAKNTETHTLETHIYRLRRKIEPDSASPMILKKDEEGYFLGNQAE